MKNMKMQSVELLDDMEKSNPLPFLWDQDRCGR